MANPRTPDEALRFIANISKNGPAFKKNQCKMRTRMAYNVASRSDDATEAFHETKHRLKVAPEKAPRGALAWWTGGSEGHGHVAVLDGKGGAWSTDIKRSGQWDHVKFDVIGKTFTKLKFAGVSLDIDGVQVVPTPRATRKTTAVKRTEPLEVTRIRNAIRVKQEIPLDALDALIKRGQAPYSASAKQLRDVIRPAVKRWTTAIKAK
jgi:hypothetical protein